VAAVLAFKGLPADEPLVVAPVDDDGVIPAVAAA
jgi:hypothetical protein